MANEANAVKAFIGDLLKASAPLVAIIGQKVYDTNPPREAPRENIYPYVAFSVVTSGEYTSGESQLASEMLFQIKAVTNEDDSETAGNIVGLYEAALKSQKLNITLGADTFWVANMTRRNVIGYVEEDGDQRYQHEGGIYRFFVERL